MSASRKLCTSRAAGGGLGAGVDQIGDGFGLREVNLVVQKSAFGELTGGGYAQTNFFTSLQAARQQELQYHRPAVGLQFQHIFTRVAMRCREVDGQALVDGRAVFGFKGQVGGLSGLEGLTAQRIDDGLHRGTGHPHNAHRAASRGGGDGGNRVGVAREHRLILS
jgi:hypothetical protein